MPEHVYQQEQITEALTVAIFGTDSASPRRHLMRRLLHSGERMMPPPKSVSTAPSISVLTRIERSVSSTA